MKAEMGTPSENSRLRRNAGNCSAGTVVNASWGCARNLAKDPNDGLPVIKPEVAGRRLPSHLRALSGVRATLVKMVFAMKRFLTLGIRCGCPVQARRKRTQLPG